MCKGQSQGAAFRPLAAGCNAFALLLPAVSTDANPGEGEKTRSVQSPRIMVGVRGFEPPASTSRTLRSNQAELHPDAAAPSSGQGREV